ncbi:MAG TPA: sigma-70 family RNA polymerase sigma factor [Rhizobiaceae bacterium]|nr:sigma-70 family RNA polymerase sigma factor [Rhizobiaceae bacterium]
MDPKSRFDVLGQLASLRRYAMSLARNPVDAEDLVHDTLVRAYERRNTFHHDGNLKRWLLSILHNVHVDAIRSQRSAAVRERQVASSVETEEQPPQDHAVRLKQVRQAFFNLPEEQRAALSLVSIEGLSYQEAAEALGIPLGTLMSRIGRARARLREMEELPQSRNHLRIVGGLDD